MTDDELSPSADEITLGTIRNWAQRNAAAIDHVAGYASAHAAGYRNAVRDVQAILDMHGAPPDQPVVFSRD